MATSHYRPAALDGLYIIRTPVPANEMEAADCVRNYKSLASIERAFRSLKAVDLKVRPIHHRLADRVRLHIFLCVLAYYLEWHMREAWRALMFADPDLAAKVTRDPVTPAVRSEVALKKVTRHALNDDSPAHSFATLMADLATIVRNTCHTPHAAESAPTFDLLTTPTAKQQHALQLLRQITVQSEHGTQPSSQSLERQGKFDTPMQELQFKPRFQLPYDLISARLNLLIRCLHHAAVHGTVILSGRVKMTASKQNRYRAVWTVPPTGRVVANED